MSRIIVKNLPPQIKEEKLRNTFASRGDVTDIQLKFTKGGVFRKFAFIGFKTEVEAQNAVDFFNKSYVDSSRIQVELAKNLGDANLDRPWSKYSEKSSAFQKKQKAKEEKESTDDKKTTATQDTLTKKKKKKKGLEGLGDLEDDPKFQEFLEAHNVKTGKGIWDNDAGISKKDQSKGDGDRMDRIPMKAKKYSDGKNTMDEEESDVDEDDDEEEEEMEEEVQEDQTKKEANKKELSDMDYLKSKRVKVQTEDEGIQDGSSEDESSSSDEDSEEEEEEEEEEGEENKKAVQTEVKEVPNVKASPTTERVRKNKVKLMRSVRKDEKYERGDFTIKMRGVPFNVKEEDVVKFFAPLSMKTIRAPLNEKGQRTGVIFVEFASEDDITKAMKRNREYMGRRYVELFREEAWNKDAYTKHQEEPPWAKQAAELENSEDTIAETGRLFVRNLAYICKEEDLEFLFSKYGPLTEVNLPIDTFTKKIKGFAFVTFMMPEHAVRAYTELDGTSFQGRMLHILPGKEKKVEEETHKEGSSFKNKKAAKTKAQSGSSHNWNTLFISANAVADVMAAKYQTSKSDILDPESSRSLGVRMALGETQIVAETRQFLLDNGVLLDSFSQAAAARSKSVFLVKNLPASTTPEELREVFSQHGMLGRVLMPPAGVTSIVEFLEPTEARAAFYQLAYTKFKHVPLYLEWAPMDVFGTSIKSLEKTPAVEETKEEKKEELEEVKKEEPQEESESDDEHQVQEGSVLFVKNLNFSTDESILKKAFKKCGSIRNVTIARKKDTKNQGELLSMGYGFIEFEKPEWAQKALKEYQHVEVEGHNVELKISNRSTVQTQQSSSRKKQKAKKQMSTKILVRNIPFEASSREIRELFITFGEVKTVRLPKKMSGTGSHRGFGFVDFLSKQDAKRAFDSLCHSSHLYGRRLVLEWAESEQSVEQLRKKTADHFSDGSNNKKLKKSDLTDHLTLSSVTE
ncbi:probable RNA-binding protein 19 [Strongylocentrotus purpuratus]|uniref:RRM domain-containing protein n=1 Tax=Strongylocentrotus purpuratus TaxID=7668 RepID=A0A7M7P6X5_STRPU|nr:probable RNA-binding protein 19 [Strongylocentrotus purpuratus]